MTHAFWVNEIMQLFLAVFWQISYSVDAAKNHVHVLRFISQVSIFVPRIYFVVTFVKIFNRISFLPFGNMARYAVKWSNRTVTRRVCQQRRLVSFVTTYHVLNTDNCAVWPSGNMFAVPSRPTIAPCYQAVQSSYFTEFMLHMHFNAAYYL